jgi:hypothetical protein
MNSAAQTLRFNFGFSVSNLPQKEKVYHVRQLLIDLMDYTEQTDDEKLWCSLNEELERLYPDYVNC